MEKKKWTDDEIELFQTKTNKEIAEITGRTVGAVASKRFHLKGIAEHEKIVRHTKIARIIGLAERLRVRLRG